MDVDELDAAPSYVAAHGWQAAGTPQVMAAGRAGHLAHVRDHDVITLELVKLPAQ